MAASAWDILRDTVVALHYLPLFLIIIGVPVAALKLCATLVFLDRRMLRWPDLLVRSMATGTVAGYAAIYLSLRFPGTQILFKVITVLELLAAAALTTAPLLSDIYHFRFVQTLPRKAVARWRFAGWLVASNLWVVGALWLFFAATSSDFRIACEGLGLRLNGSDYSSCVAAPRAFWSEHLKYFEEALGIGRAAD